MTALEIIQHIDPTGLGYSEWLSVGLALKHEGFSASDWDEWSRADPRYRERDCFSRWDGFRGSSTPVTAGTLVALAKAQGWRPDGAAKDPGRALSWDDVVHFGPTATTTRTVVDDKPPIIDADWLDEQEIPPPEKWDPVNEVCTYLSCLFESHEYVALAVDSYLKADGKYDPGKGTSSRTAGELTQALTKCGGDIGAVLGDSVPEAGAWVRFNPVDGKGVADINITQYRYCLVESDEIGIERQAAFCRELELPIAVMVHSGNKSVHAIVRVDAADKDEYRNRVAYIYNTCIKAGFPVDVGNRNPSRLSRLPGIMRNGRPQYIVAKNIGKASFADWKEFVEESHDNLPDIEPIASVFDNPPPLADALIEGMLRQRHKMLVAGPSKAGKSFLLLQLAIAVAEGGNWIGFPCQQGRVLYVNLELDKASCINRIVTLYKARGGKPQHLDALDVWHLRGNAAPLDKLAPKLIRRAMKKKYSLVIIDPIYKVLTGSEKEAEDMALFCNQFDRICAELGAATVYCHHHSKGMQGQKASIDRSSGSGVFARDPDAILDLIELNVPETAKKTSTDRAVCDMWASMLDELLPNWTTIASQDDLLTVEGVRRAVWGLLDEEARLMLSDTERALRSVYEAQTGWRIEATLREFREFPPRHVWFRYPLHVVDTSGILLDAKADGEEAPWEAKQRERKASGEKRDGGSRNPIRQVETTYMNVAGFTGAAAVPITDIVEGSGLTLANVEKGIKNSDSLVKLAKDGKVISKAAVVAGLALALEAGGTLLSYAESLGVSDKTVQRWKNDEKKKSNQGDTK
jgi:RecA-family ATPase